MNERELITSRSQFDALLRQAFEVIAEQGGREVWICDEDFVDWPLNDREVLDALVRWARPHRRLTMIARQFDDIVRRHPRFVDWRRQWSHVIDCRSPDSDTAPPLPAVFLAPGLAMLRLSDARLHRGVASLEPAEHLRTREQIDAIAQRTVASFPSTLLGL